MAVDAIEMKLDEIEKWAADRPVNRDELRLMLELAREHLGHETPGSFSPGDIEELLLEVYPERVEIPTEVDAVQIVEAARDLVDFIEETTETTGELLVELEDAAPQFIGIVGDGQDNGLADMLEQLGLPRDRLPGVRLPSADELLASAKQSKLLAKAHELAAWAGDGKEIDDEDELTEESVAQAAAALGIADQLDVRVLADVAEFAGFASTESGSYARLPGGFEQWPDGEDVMGIWQAGFISTFGFVLDRVAEFHGSDIEFSDVPGNLLIMMFMTRDVGLPRSEISDLIHELTEDEWHDYVDEHGDPADFLIRVMLQIGGFEEIGGNVRYSALALNAVREHFVLNGIDVPLLPPAAEMTAEDLAVLALQLSGPEMESEQAAWLATRDADQAARELLAVAADGPAQVRVWATGVVTELGVPEVWRAVIDIDTLRPYARYALGETELELAELGWITIDGLTLFVAADEQGMPGIEPMVAELLPAGTEEELLDAMWRLPHPDVVAALNLLGKYHPDKKVAKHARKVAHKATTLHSQG
ncbi:hypothetical protein LWC34_39370 [Kibdelosporangium philippinense]|uniref:Uncharacterized protein n=1 Tax=Kibdelosporangium philippinense TaxID=211113 RepID=A0ABS8ZPG8_9PSEU|nr:hypothetical protein [Kibdelosporangium philippinense]MCE7008830.1 hypothetical protein [Kibdelosporangium philippinense]